MRMLWLCGLLLLTGCEKMKVTPVPVADTPLPGHWFGERQQSLGGTVQAHDRLYLHVTADGYVDFHFLGCESGAGNVQEKRLDLYAMPIKRLTTVKMVLQTFPLTPKYELTLGVWPDQGAGVWEVDGLALRNADQAVPPFAQWRCAGSVSQQEVVDQE